MLCTNDGSMDHTNYKGTECEIGQSIDTDKLEELLIA